MALLMNSRVILRSVATAARSLNISNNFSSNNVTLSRLQQPMPQAFHTSSIHLNKNIINIQDEEDFKKQVVESAVPVIVDFHATWCGPCKLIGPRLEALVGAQEGKVVLAKVDIDDLAEIAMDHEVQAVPTVIGMKDGKVIDSFVGVKDDDQLKSFIRGLTGS